MSELNLVARCAFGLEAVVRRELESLGYSGRITDPGTIEFSGDASAIVRANLWLRCADRVMVQVARFEAADFEALFETTRSLEWESWIPDGFAFPVIGKSIQSQLSSVPAVQRSVKRAVVDRLQQVSGKSTLEESGPTVRIEIALRKNIATLSLDTTGPGLNKRGYRTRIGSAALKETLAAALVQLSFWRPDRPLVDPFCGSGTIPIEAVWIATNRAPGLDRSFDAQQWPRIDGSLWNRACDEAADLRQPPPTEAVIGTDIDPRAIRLAQQHAIAAGVADLIHFQVKPFEELSSSRKFGCVITNPPYGHRLGSGREIEALYDEIPVVLRKLPTWSHFILAAATDFERRVGREADRRRKLYNGRIECTYYQFHGPRPGQRPPRDDSEEASPNDDRPRRPAGGAEKQPPVFGQLDARSEEQAELFAARLRKRARHLRRLPTRRGITCFRLYERDIPEIPLVVDRYEDHLHIGEFERPHERDPAQHANWLDRMARTAAETLQVRRDRVFLKQRRRQRGREQHQPIDSRGYEIEVREGGLKFLVNLSDYVDTGLFLDHRQTREMVRQEAAGRRVLNLFAYTGSFSVYAADGGAAETTTVDWSNTYLDWARRNMQLNGFTGDEHRFVEDSLQYLRSLPRQPRFDLAVVDPPTFSNSKRTAKDWKVQDEYAELLNETLCRMPDGAVVFFSTNFRRFKMDASRVEASVVHEITRQTIPDEYRNQRIHRCWRIVK